MLLFTIIGIGIGVSKSLMTTDYYKTSLIAQSTIVPNDLIISIINNLQLIIDENDLAKLAKDLKISKNNADNIKSIQASLISNTLEGSRFQVVLEVYDVSIIDSIRDGLVEYINIQNYIKERSLILRNQQLELIAILNNKIDQVDSLQKIALNSFKAPLKNDEVLILNENKSFHKELIELFEKKQTIEKQYQLSKEIESIENFSPLSLQSATDKKYIVITSFTFFMFGLFVSVFIEIKNKIAHRLKEIKGNL